MESEKNIKMIKAGLKCSFVVQKTIKQKLKALKMYKQSNYGYHRNWSILSVQIGIITGYYHTTYTIRINKTCHFEKIV